MSSYIYGMLMEPFITFIGDLLTSHALFGDLTAVFSLLFDNLVNLISLGSIIESVGAPSNLVTTNLYLGSLVGVIFGNIVIYILTTKQIIRLDVSIPFGIDAPTIFFVAYAMADLYLQKTNTGMGSDQALLETWGNGASIILVIGLVKFGLTCVYCIYDFPSKINEKAFAGCLAGIGIALLGMNNLEGIFAEPLSGLVSLFVFLMVTLPDVPRNRWSNCIPHFMWSVLIGVPLYYILTVLPYESGATTPAFFYALPNSKYMFSYRFDSGVNKYLVQSVSYAFLVFAGGYSVIKVAIEDDTEEDGKSMSKQEQQAIQRKVLFLDSITTIITSLFGGLIQTTPYIGYNTYKKLGARTNYSWLFACLLLALSATGIISYVADALPLPVLKPVFVLIALQIAQFAFGVNSIVPEVIASNKILPAVVMALFPSIAHLMQINGNTAEVITVISAGFVITSILWAQVTYSIITSDPITSCIIFVTLSALTFVGIIHSFDGDVYYDIWNHGSYIPVYCCIAYGICAPLALIFVPYDRNGHLYGNGNSSSKQSSFQRNTDAVEYSDLGTSLLSVNKNENDV